MPLLLSQIDELTRGDHSYLTEADDCRYVREYTSGQRYDYSPTNQLISNLKIPLSSKGNYRWQYKLKAIASAAQDFCSCVNHDWLRTSTLIPIPPSQAKGDPEYDERVFAVLQHMNRLLGGNLDIRELILQRETTDAFHRTTGQRRPRPAEVATNYYLDLPLIRPTPTKIGLFDDVLTTGSHFKGAQMILEDAFPGVEIRGIFLARRAFLEDSDEEVLFDFQ